MSMFLSVFCWLRSHHFDFPRSPKKNYAFNEVDLLIDFSVSRCTMMYPLVILTSLFRELIRTAHRNRKKSMIYHDFAGKKNVIFHGILALGARLMANSWPWLLALAAGWGPKSSWLVNGWTANMIISYVT